MKKLASNDKGQAILEMAIFGALVLFIFGILVSFSQGFDSQQYVKMEAFRRTLQKACTYQGSTSGGAGGSVQLSFIENRRNVDLSGGFKKGSPSATSGSSSVFWAVPKVGAQPENIIIYRINQDESPNLPRGTVIDAIVSDQQTLFDETMAKKENPQDITTQRESQLTDTIVSTVKDVDNNTVWEVAQGLYRDKDGQYKYSSQAVGNQVDRGRIWKTKF